MANIFQSMLLIGHVETWLDELPHLKLVDEFEFRNAKLGYSQEVTQKGTKNGNHR
jgi:hypothetical protein